MFSLPNILTYLRIVFIPVIFWMLMQYTDGGNIVMATQYAFLLYVFLALTDFFDGYLSRKMNLTSEIGRFLDPIADKLLVVACLFALAQTKFLGVLETSLATVIILREVFVSGLREYVGGYGVKIHVTKLAKYKTTLQLIATGLLILGNPFGKFTIRYALINVPEHIYTAGVCVLALAAFITVITGLDYFRGALHVMRQVDRQRR